MLVMLKLCVEWLRGLWIVKRAEPPELTVLRNWWRSPEHDHVARRIEARLFFEPYLLQEAQRLPIQPLPARHTAHRSVVRL